jgi:amino acid transporter
MDPQRNTNGTFGTSAVFFTAISTILGAILFLRFGYAVANVGFLGVVAIIAIGHMVTIPTAMALAEIATNQKVEGGGEYYIVSRSFGLIIGASIGIGLYLSQAISVAFYIIAFAEAFRPLMSWVQQSTGVALTDPRVVSLPALAVLALVILLKGSALGLRTLYVVVTVLFLALALFFLGRTSVATGSLHALVDTIDSPDSLFKVFAICFPAFTGMTAGVGLSGDLRDPKRSIPIGTLTATLAGMVVYVFVAWKLAASLPAEDLAADQLVMQRIALWGPIIPIGLGCATISSAIGSFLVAPRTLQAISSDQLLPWPRLSSWLARGHGARGEPFHATLVTAALALVFVALGNVNFVAQIISMFFMVTYGSICLISFLEHFAADPSYRPTFRSRWYVSFFGAALCVWLMFQMSAFYAIIAIVSMLGLYLALSHSNEDKQGLSHIVQGAIFQISRQLHVFLQKSRKESDRSWRPSVVCISQASFERFQAFDLLRWISHRYGFGTYIHLIEGYLSRSTQEEAQNTLQRLVQMADVSRSNVYVDTLVSPAYTSAVAQVIQLPGISGKENNMILFEFAKDEGGELEDIIENFNLVSAANFDVAILMSDDRSFGYRRQIHVWLVPGDYANANLMILLAYILLGHPDWKGAVIKIFSVCQQDTLEEERESLRWLIRTGRLPITAKNVELILRQGDIRTREIIGERSRDADLVIVGFRSETLRHQKADLFSGYEEVGNVLFVNTRKEIALEREVQEGTAARGDADAITDSVVSEKDASSVPETEDAASGEAAHRSMQPPEKM